MLKPKRRSVIKLAGSAAAVASTGMAGILASGRTPAYAQQKTVHWLRWVDFVPASDTLMRKELMPQAEKDLGIKIGDSITVNVLGRNLSAKVANLREVKWESLALNFVMVFSPNTLAGAPHNLLATISLPKTSGTVE